MIEEAAGTRMYESKKQQAQKTIEKKDAKLKEINDVRHTIGDGGWCEESVAWTNTLGSCFSST